MLNTPGNISLFENYINEIMQIGEAAGLAVSVFNSDGTVLYEKCFGLRDSKKQLPMTDDTVMGIASMSKSFTALSIMQLCERGIIDIEKPVKAYIPEFENPEICIKHLLSHTAGFYPLYRKSCKTAAKEAGLAEGEDILASAEAAACGLKELLADMNAVQEYTGRPGENFSYSNDGYALLSEIVRLCGGEKTYPEYLNKNILVPLGMADTKSTLKYSGEKVSVLYQREDSGEMSDRWTMEDDQSPHGGASGIRSTLKDMRKYVLMYLNYGKGLNGTRVLSEYGIREMMRPRAKASLGSYYGYGLYSQEMEGLAMWGHGGDQPGVAGMMNWSEESGVGVVVLCNTAQTASAAIAKKAIRLASGLPFNENEDCLQPVEWSDEQMDDVCGMYMTGEGTKVIINRAENQFLVEIDGAHTIGFPVNRYMIRVKAMAEDMLTMVYRDENGKVFALGGGYRMLKKVNA